MVLLSLDPNNDNTGNSMICVKCTCEHTWYWSKCSILLMNGWFVDLLYSGRHMRPEVRRICLQSRTSHYHTFEQNTQSTSSYDVLVNTDSSHRTHVSKLQQRGSISRASPLMPAPRNTSYQIKHLNRKQRCVKFYSKEETNR